MCWGSLCRVTLLNLTKHEEIPSSHDCSPSATTLSLSYFPFLIESSYFCNHITQGKQPREHIGAGLSLLFDTAAGKQSTKRLMKACVCSVKPSCTLGPADTTAHVLRVSRSLLEMNNLKDAVFLLRGLLMRCTCRAGRKRGS